MKTRIATTLFLVLLICPPIINAELPPRGDDLSLLEWRPYIRSILNEFGEYLPEYREIIDSANVSFTKNDYPAIKINFYADQRVVKLFHDSTQGSINYIVVPISFIELAGSEDHLRITLAHELGHFIKNISSCRIVFREENLFVLEDLSGKTTITNSPECATREFEVDVFAIDLVEKHYPVDAMCLWVEMLNKYANHPDGCNTCDERITLLTAKYRRTCEGA